MSFLVQGLCPELDVHSRWGLTTVKLRHRTSSLDLQDVSLSMQQRIQLALWAVRARCWLTSSFSSTSTLKPFSKGLHGNPSSLRLYQSWGLFCLRFKALHLDFLNFMRFSWITPSGISGSAFSFCMTCKVAEVVLNPAVCVTDDWSLYAALRDTAQKGLSFWMVKAQSKVLKRCPIWFSHFLGGLDVTCCYINCCNSRCAQDLWSQYS